MAGRTPRPDPDQLANELLDEVKRQRAQASAGVPFLLRSPELMALAPALRPEVLRHARRAMTKEPRFILLLLVWLAVSLAILFYLAPPQFAALGVIAPVAWRSWQLRRRARQLARELLAQG